MSICGACGKADRRIRKLPELGINSSAVSFSYIEYAI